MTSKPKTPTLAFATVQAWEKWLHANHAKSAGVWLKLARVGASAKSVTHPQALDIALRYGWIDGVSMSLDDTHWLRKFVPRAPRSLWSEKNRTRALELIEEGKMKPPGLHEVERAKADGRWAAAYAAQSEAKIPPDLSAALATNKKARDFFAALDSKNRYAILHRLHTAKKAETRARRLATFMTMLERGERLHVTATAKK